MTYMCLAIMYEKGIYYVGIILFSILLRTVKSLKNHLEVFKLALKEHILDINHHTNKCRISFIVYCSRTVYNKTNCAFVGVMINIL